MNKFLKPAALVVINALVGFGYTANTFAQEETETQPVSYTQIHTERYGRQLACKLLMAK